MMRLPATGELIAVAVLGLCGIGAMFVPWSEIESVNSNLKGARDGDPDEIPSVFHNPYEESKLSSKRLNRESAWNADFDYRPSGGELSVTLKSAQGRPTRNMSLTARFIPHDGSAPERAAVLWEQPDGRYRASGVKLNQGSWTMSLTGWSRTGFAFWMEHVVRVD